jgi:hypothetical protein
VGLWYITLPAAEAPIIPTFYQEKLRFVVKFFSKGQVIRERRRDLPHFTMTPERIWGSKLLYLRPRSPRLDGPRLRGKGDLTASSGLAGLPALRPPTEFRVHEIAIHAGIKHGQSPADAWADRDRLHCHLEVGSS